MPSLLPEQIRWLSVEGGLITVNHTITSIRKPSDLISTCSVFFQYKQAFFEDLWNWLIYGYLEEAENKFFIVPSDEEEIFKFATSDLPSIDPALLRRILMHGKLIALFQANYAIGWREIFADSLDDLAGEFKSLCSSEEYTEIQLTEFIKNATDVLLKVIQLPDLLQLQCQTFNLLSLFRTVLQHSSDRKAKHLEPSQTDQGHASDGQPLVLDEVLRRSGQENRIQAV